MKKIFLSIAAILTGLLLTTTPVFAACSDAELERGCVNTVIIGNGCSCDDGNGSSIIDILKLVADIMTVGIGILGVIGILIVGTQYLSAGGNEEKTKKAKRRLFEIIIGLVVYVVLYAGLRFILPSFNGIQYPDPQTNSQGSSGCGSYTKYQGACYEKKSYTKDQCEKLNNGNLYWNNNACWEYKGQAQ